MVTQTDVREAQAWFRQHRNYEEVLRAMLNRLARNGHGSASEYARLEPDEFVTFVDGLAEMVEQLPEDQLHEANGHALRDGVE